MNIEEYRSQIDRAIRQGTGEPILNGSHEHATVIIERMFAHARQCVEILTRRFDPRIYGTAETVEQASLYLGQPERRCRVLIEEIDEAALGNHPFIKTLTPFLESGNLEIKQIPPHLADVINLNFAVMDDYGFRLEQDKKQAVAIAAFGEKADNLVKGLKGFYASIWDASRQIHPRESATVA